MDTVVEWHDRIVIAASAGGGCAFSVRASAKNDCVVNYRLRLGRRTAKLYSSGRALRRGAGIGTLCCPWVAAGSLSGIATSTHGGRSVEESQRVMGHGVEKRTE